MKVLVERKRFRITRIMVVWICLLCMLLHLRLTLARGEEHPEQFQGVIMEKDSLERAIYVNEMKFIVKKDTDITNTREVRLSFESLCPKQWVFIQAHLEGKILVADKIVLIPRYIPPKERWKYRFMRTRISK